MRDVDDDKAICSGSASHVQNSGIRPKMRKGVCAAPSCVKFTTAGFCTETLLAVMANRSECLNRLDASNTWTDSFPNGNHGEGELETLLATTTPESKIEKFKWTDEDPSKHSQAKRERKKKGSER